MILYQTALSSYSAKVRLAAALKGATLELREPPGGSYRSPEYRALVPAATVPALVDGALTLSESDAIVEYLNETLDGPALLGADAGTRARTRMLSRLVDLRIEAALRPLYPGLTAARQPSAEALAPARSGLALVLALADRDGPFLTGDDPRLADCGLAVACVWLDLAGGPGALTPALADRLARWRQGVAGETRLEAVLSPYRALAAAWLAAR